MSTTDGLKNDLLPIALSLAVSTLLTITVTAVTLRYLMRLASKRTHNRAGNAS